MSSRIRTILVALALLIAACSGGGESEIGADGVRPFGGSSPTAVTGTRSVEFGDFRMNVTMEDDWSVVVNEQFEPHNATSLVISPVGTVVETPSVAFMRPSSLVETSALSYDSDLRPEGRTIDLSNSMDIEEWLGMLPSEVTLGPLEPFELAGMAAVKFELEVEASLCERNCSFLLIEQSPGQGGFFIEAIWTGIRNTIIWAEQGEGELPVVVLIAGDDEEFQSNALAVVNSAEIAEPGAT